MGSSIPSPRSILARLTALLVLFACVPEDSAPRSDPSTDQGSLRGAGAKIKSSGTDPATTGSASASR